jgi:hypothetical protein
MPESVRTNLLCNSILTAKSLIIVKIIALVRLPLLFRNKNHHALSLRSDPNGAFINMDVFLSQASNRNKALLIPSQ